MGAWGMDHEAESRESAAEDLAVPWALEDGGGEFLLGIEVESGALKLMGDFLELEENGVILGMNLVEEGLPVEGNRGGRSGCGRFGGGVLRFGGGRFGRGI